YSELQAFEESSHRLHSIIACRCQTNTHGLRLRALPDAVARFVNRNPHGLLRRTIPSIEHETESRSFPEVLLVIARNHRQRLKRVRLRVIQGVWSRQANRKSDLV